MTDFWEKLDKIDHPNDFKVFSIRLQNHMINRISDVVKKRGFSSKAEFYRYAIRKELDYQTDLIYIPRVIK